MKLRKPGILKKDRPVIKPGMEPIDWILEILAIITMLSFLGFMLYHYTSLPETIPTHFNAAGEPDAYGGKINLLLLPAIVLVVYSLLTLFSRIPEKFNYPVRITQQNARVQYTMGLRMIRIMKLGIAILFFIIAYRIVMATFGRTSGLGSWLIPLYLGIILIPVIVYFILALRNR